MKTALLFLSAFLCLALATQPSAAQTVAVGKCQPHLTSYSTISAAVAAEPSGATILICPGNYPEQVVITQPVTLKGLSLNTGSNPVVTVPKGGLASGTVAQISAQENPIGTFGPVNISNLIVDGSNSGVVCSDTSYLVGIGYEQSWGTLENLEVRNQSPGGCGVGIEMFGGPEEGGTWVLRNSFIHDFDSQGVWAGSQYPGFTIASNSVASAIGSGIILDGPGTAANNIISVGGQIGLELGSVYCCDTATYNTITGAVTGIQIDSDLSTETYDTNVAHNSLVNNQTGIVILGYTVGSTLIESNSIVDSAIAAMDLQCARGGATVKQNSIFNAPVAFVNAPPDKSAGFRLSGNVLYKVTAATSSTSTCYGS